MSRRNRSVLVTSAPPGQVRIMEDSLDHLASVLKSTKRDWKQVATRNPLELALPLLDNSSVGLAHRYEEFTQLDKQVDSALRAAVTAHYDEFSNSVGSYLMLVRAVGSALENTERVRTLMNETSRSLGLRKEALHELNQSSKRCGEMLDLLEAIEELQACSDSLDTAVGEKNFFEAHSHLSQARSVADRHGLWGLGALSGIKQHLESQENNLFNVVIEEILAVIYLKHSLDVSAMVSIMDPSLEDRTKFDHMGVTEKAEALNRPVQDFLGDADAPDSSLRYLRSLLTVTAKLGRMDQTLLVLATRHPAEYHQLVVDTARDTRARYANLLKTLAGLSDDFSGNLAASVVEDLFAHIYVKTLAVLQSHRAVKATVLGLSSTTLFAYAFSDVWNVVRSELGLLMAAYLDGEEHQTQGTGQTLKTLFQYSNIEVEHPFVEKLFPGVTSPSLYLANETFVYQDTLVPGSVLHMRAMLDKFLVFCLAVDLLDTPTKFYQDFMESSFLPQLEQYVMLRYMTQTDGTNGFAATVYNSEEPPVFKNAVGMHNIFFELCEMFHTGGGFRQSYACIVVKTLQIFTEKYALLAERLLPAAESSGLVGQWSRAPVYADPVLEARAKLAPGVSVFAVGSHELVEPETFEEMACLAETAGWVSQWASAARRECSGPECVRSEKSETGEAQQWVIFEASPCPSGLRSRDGVLFLTGEPLLAFDECVDKLKEIHERALLTVRFELECKSVYGIGRLFSEPDWALVSEAQECDEVVVWLTKELVASSTKLKEALQPESQRTALAVLPELLDQLLILGSENIKVINAHGVRKIILDISVLRQMLRTVIANPEEARFTQSMAYYGMFEGGDTAVVERGSMFNYKQKKNMLRLVFSEAMTLETPPGDRKTTIKRFSEAVERLLETSGPNGST